MLANWITLSRFPILVTTVLALYLGSPTARLAGVAPTEPTSWSCGCASPICA